MPITTQEQIDELRQQVKDAITKADTDGAIALLLEAIPSNRPKNNQVLLLAGRMRDIYNADVTNTLPYEQLEILRNELRHDLLLFTDRLTLTDFSENAPARPELKPGHLLYKVPKQMLLRESTECLVRVAHQLNHVLQGLTLDDSITLEEVPVAEIMEVEIIDPNGYTENRSFDILLLSDAEQLVDAYSYTEWVFNVRPLREGTHQLVLKISVLITVNGKERTKNIVLRRPIEVTAKAESQTSTPLTRVATNTLGGSWDLDNSPVAPQPASPPQSTIEYEPYARNANEQELTPKSAPPLFPAPPTARKSARKQAPGPGGPMSSPPKTKQRSLFRRLSAAASILLLVTCGFFLFRSGDEPQVNAGESQKNPSVVTPDDGSAPVIVPPVANPPTRLDTLRVQPDSL